TMVGRIVGRHPDIFTFHEIHFFEQLWRPSLTPDPWSPPRATQVLERLLHHQRDGYFARPRPGVHRAEAQEILRGLDEPYLPSRVYNRFLEHESRLHAKTIPCDHTPRNLFYLDEIMDAFPGAKVLNPIRDPRDVLLSQKRKWKRRSLGATNIPAREALRAWANYHPITMSLFWRRGVEESMRHIADPRVKAFRYEDLVHDPASMVRGLCEFLEVPFHSGMLDVPSVGSSIDRDRGGSQGITAKSVGRWRDGLGQGEVQVCEFVCHAQMATWGYESSGPPSVPLSLLLMSLAWPLKTALSLAMNLGRFRQLPASIKRRLVGK
ncbi:MAG: sulfotransferase, partial [Anaerolineales bacterium]